MRIGILTGGGDVPGLNPCIKAVVNRVAHDGHEVVGLRRGWAGLLKHDLDDPASAAEWFQPLDPVVVRTIDRTGGTFLHTSRTNPSRVRAERGARASRRPRERRRPVRLHRPRAPRRRGARDRRADPDRRRRHVVVRAAAARGGRAVVAIPKTMDNDVYGTDYCIGFSTAVTRGVQFIHNLRTSPAPTSGSRSSSCSAATAARRRSRRLSRRGRPCGHLGSALRRGPARRAARGGQAREPDQLRDLAVSEGATLAGGDMVVSGEEDAYGHRKLGGIGELTAALIKESTGEEMIVAGARLPDALRCTRLARPDGRDQLRGHGRRSRDRGASGRMVALRRARTRRCRSRRRAKASSAWTSTSSTTPSEYRPKVRTSSASRCSCTE